MIKSTEISQHADAKRFLIEARHAFHTNAIEDLLRQLPVIRDDEYVFHTDDPSIGWKEGHLHWYPVGRERGNAGRIKLAGAPENPIAERTVNSFEAAVELKRQLELLNGSVDPPQTPREAVQRYFDLPPLSEVPKLRQPINGKKPREYIRELAKQIRIRLVREGRPAQYSIAIEDDGIGQVAHRIHSTLLSLGQSDKADKPYLIGVFGQGGSSAYAACATRGYSRAVIHNYWPGQKTV